ncbi:MAG: lipopolysaccharide transport system permease protein [Bacteroidia bacterium]|jgi:lipopolysaccharide transport system permease protein
MAQQEENWSLIIKPHSKWWDLKLGEIWEYRDLVWIFVRRDIVAVYKQTVLGPLWFFLAPIFTVIAYNFVFGTIAGMSTDGIPGPVFYLAGTTLWGYFQTSFMATSSTFSGNAAIFGKVYFPRMVAPISTVLSSLFKFGIQMLMFLAFIAYYTFVEESTIHFTKWVLLFPVLIIMMSGLALGLGIIVSSLTTKYRDLKNFVGFGITLLMYASPIIYPASAVEAKFGWLIKINPIAPIIEAFRLGFTGSGTVTPMDLVISGVFITITLVIGLMMFHKVEKTFMDTV